MSLWRLAIAGALVLAAIYVVASAVKALVPYAMGALVVWLIFIGLQRWLSKLDDATPTRQDEAP